MDVNDPRHPRWRERRTSGWHVVGPVGQSVAWHEHREHAEGMAKELKEKHGGEYSIKAGLKPRTMK